MSDATGNDRREQALRILAPAGVLAFGVVLWDLVVRVNGIPPYILPGPGLVASTLVSDWPILWSSLLATLETTIEGLLLAVTGGIGLAVLFNQSRLIEHSLYPYAVILQVTPVVAVAPLLLIYLPQQAAVLACAWIVAFFPVLANTTLGLNSVDHNLADLFRLYGASRWQVLAELKLPAALPQMLAGVKIAGGLSLIGAVVAEIAAGSAGAGSGLAYRIAESALGLVGESGCGKSTLGRTIIKLTDALEGQIFYKRQEILRMKESDFRHLRKDIQIIFQDPYSSLNPRLTIGDALNEPMKVHGIGKNNQERKKMVYELLDKVGMEAKYYSRYPHEFSGGQRQRVCIARALSLNPKFIICDESVSALDVSVQAQVLNLLNDLKKEFKFTYIFISHDLSVVKFMSDRMVVMNQGKIEEMGDADDICNHPKSEYTQKLINSIPKGRADDIRKHLEEKTKVNSFSGWLKTPEER